MEDKENEMQRIMLVMERRKKSGMLNLSTIVKNMLKMRNENNEPYFNAEFLYKRFVGPDYKQYEN